MVDTTVMRAADFLSTLGVNTHIPYTDGGYANLNNVRADLAYLGITKVRDPISDGAAGSAPLSSYIQLAQQGITFDILLFVGGDHTLADVATNLALVERLAAAAPGSVTAIEGANEINNFPLTFGGIGGLAGAVALQEAIYAAVKATPLLQGASVYYFTGYDAGGIAAGPNPATTPGLADADTQHPYPNQGEAPQAWVARAQALGNEHPATGPAVYTETGYSTNGGTGGAVNQDVQARYTLDLLMDDAKQGIAMTYLYQLMDAYQPGSPQGDDGFGLFDPANQPKEAAVALHDLTAILADPGSRATTFTTTPLAYTLPGLPSTGDSLELQKSSGATDIVVWAEPAIWDEASGHEIAAPVSETTLDLGKTYAQVKIFDPLLGTAPVQTLTGVSRVTLALTDHPLIVEVAPQVVSTTSGGGSDAVSGGGTAPVSSAGSSPASTPQSNSTASGGASAASTPAVAGQTVPSFLFLGATSAMAGLAQSRYGAGFAQSDVTFAGPGGIPAPRTNTAALVLTGGSTAPVPTGYATVLDTASGDRLTVSGAATIFLQHETALETEAGPSLVFAAGADTISAGSGALTVAGGAQSLQVFGGAGSLQVVGGSGAVSVSGGTGSLLAWGSTGSQATLLMGGSGHNTLTGGSGSGASTLVGGANVTEFAGGTGPTMMVAGTGQSIMNGTTGSGAETVFTAGGTALIALNNAADTMVGGSGAATVIGGGGPTVFAFLDGHAGGSEAILGFSAIDNLAFGGFAGWAIASEHVVSGSDVMRLTDGTEITFVGLAHTLF
ncbi:hypothetical protein [Acidisoma sp. 7E03]